MEKGAGYSHYSMAGRHHHGTHVKEPPEGGNPTNTGRPERRWSGSQHQARQEHSLPYQATDMVSLEIIKSAQGGVLPAWLQGSKLTYRLAFFNSC